MGLSKTQSNLLFTFLTALLMSFLMSLAITFVNLGMVEDFTLKWMRAWGYGFLVGYPVASIVIPIVRKIINKMEI